MSEKPRATTTVGSDRASGNTKRQYSRGNFLTLWYQTIFMKILNQIQQSGWGALFLFIYSAGILYFASYELSRIIHLIVAALPALVLILLSVIYNDELMDFFAGDAIDESFAKIDERTGEDGFYYDSDQDIQDSINEMDEKAHQHLVSILSGLVIAISLPFVIYYLFGLREAALALVGSGVVAYLLSYKGRRNLQQVVKSSVKLYDTDDED